MKRGKKREKIEDEILDERQTKKLYCRKNETRFTNQQTCSCFNEKRLSVRFVDAVMTYTVRHVPFVCIMRGKVPR